MVNIEIVSPCPYLSEYIKCYWILEKGNDLHIERLFPSGETELIFHYRTPFTENCNNSSIIQPEFLCCGQFTSYKDIISDSGAGLIGIVFYPHTMKCFFGLHPAELSESTANLADIDRSYRELGCRLQDAKDNDQRIKLVERFLIKRFEVQKKSHFHLVKQSLNCFSPENGKKQLQNLWKDYKISERQFERVFKEHVGLAPRSFSEIVRFQKALSMFGRNLNLADITFDSGYYDQPQFIRSFKKFTGYTPGEYSKKVKMSV